MGEILLGMVGELVVRRCLDLDPEVLSAGEQGGQTAPGSDRVDRGEEVGPVVDPGVRETLENSLVLLMEDLDGTRTADRDETRNVHVLGKVVEQIDGDDAPEAMTDQDDLSRTWKTLEDLREHRCTEPLGLHVVVDLLESVGVYPGLLEWGDDGIRQAAQPEACCESRVLQKSLDPPLATEERAPVLIVVLDLVGDSRMLHL